MNEEIIIKDTHRGLRYLDGVMEKVLGPGRYKVPSQPPAFLRFMRKPIVEVVLVDVRERDLTIKGQEGLTADKVAIRVSIIVQFKVTDPVRPMRSIRRCSGCANWRRWLQSRRMQMRESILASTNMLSAAPKPRCRSRRADPGTGMPGGDEISS